MCDLLLVIDTNLYRILHCFHVIADYWSNLRLLTGIPLATRNTALSDGVKCISISWTI